MRLFSSASMHELQVCVGWAGLHQRLKILALAVIITPRTERASLPLSCSATELNLAMRLRQNVSSLSGPASSASCCVYCAGQRHMSAGRGHKKNEMTDSLSEAAETGALDLWHEHENKDDTFATCACTVLQTSNLR